MKIAIEVDSSRNIIGVLSTDERTAERQAKLDGWTLVDNDPNFLISEKNLWTIRESDNVLVHKSTNQTTDEENKSSLTALTMQQLKGQLADTQTQAAVTSLTKQMLQDKVTYQSAITDLTKEIVGLKLQLATSATTPVEPADVKSDATNTGAEVSAN